MNIDSKSTSLLRSSGQKRKAEPKDGSSDSVSSKKPKIGRTQNNNNKILECNNYYVNAPALQKIISRSKNAYVTVQNSKAAPALMKRIPEFNDEGVLSMKPKASLIPKNNLPEFNDTDVAYRELKTIPIMEIKIASESEDTKKPTTAPASQTQELEITMSTKRMKPPITSQNTATVLYGDIVDVLTGLVLISVIGYDMYRMELDDSKRTPAIFIYGTVASSPFICILGVLWKNVWFSRLGMALALALALNISANLMEWPYQEECTITASLQSVVLMSVMANISLSFYEKMIRLLLFLIVSSYVSIKRPPSIYFEGTLTILDGTILATIFALYAFHSGRTVAPVQCARLIVGVLFVQHAAVTLISSDHSAYENIISLLKGLLASSVGIVAAGTVQDEIIQKERLENLVQQRTQKLHMVNLALKASATSIAITDKWGCIVWANDAFERLSGEKEEILLGLAIKDVIYKLDTTTKQNKYHFMESYDNPSQPSEEDLHIGESIFHLIATPFSSESRRKEKPAHNDRFLMVFNNITAGSAREVAENNDQYKCTMAKAMGASMVILTHELRTPLQGIMGVTSLLMQQDGDLTNDAMESLRLIMASSTLLLNLINNLLDVKKENAKMMEQFPLSAMSASEPIKDAVCYCLPLALISRIKLITEMRTEKNPIVKSNRLRLQQVLINIISNAIKYTKEGSDICIKVRATTLGDVKKMIDSAIAPSQTDNNSDDDNDGSAVLVISVSDCGTGIPLNQAGRLFKPYAQLDTKPIRILGNNTVGQQSGTGLGLHLCKLFVEGMNGKIWVKNNEKGVGGSTFSFYLPLVSYTSYDTIEGPVISSGSRVSNVFSNSKDNLGRLGKKKDAESVFDRRVLLVDDILINRKVFDRMLKKIGISNRVTVESGEKALEELATNRYDLVLTDLQMPGMSGIELGAAIRDSNNESTSPIVVVGLTADTSADAAEQCSENGMSDLLYKPVTLSELKEYFEMTVPSLRPGVWYKSNLTYDGGGSDVLGVENNNADSKIPQGSIACKCSKGDFFSCE